MKPGQKNPLFRDAALARLASPDRLDARLRMPGYSRAIVAALVALLVAAGGFAAWLFAR